MSETPEQFRERLAYAYEGGRAGDTDAEAHQWGLEIVYRAGYSQALRDVIEIIEPDPMSVFIITADTLREFGEARGISLEDCDDD